MLKQFKYIIIVPLSLLVSNLFSQEKDKNNIGTEVVNVVKPYSPTVSDAYKVKEAPSLNDSVTTSKKEINYNIFSVPVASTFIPAKGKATAIPKAKREKLYNSYVSLGAGSYGNVLLDFYTNRELNKDETLNINLNHHSSQGGINGVELDDKFYNTKLEAAYDYTDRYLSWGINGGAQHQIYNWYGIPQTIDEATFNDIDEKQNYYDVYVGANLNVDDYFFKGGDILLRRFWDRFNSAEHRAIIKPEVKFPVGEQFINVVFRADYLSGKFERNYFSEDELKYQNVILGGTPKYVLLRDDITLNIGASVFYKLDMEDGDGNGVFIYPDITASYRLVDEYATIYAGIRGDLVQNSYYDFQQDNQFVSPTLFITPTDMQYDAFGGVKGKFLPNVGYNVKASYKVENDKPLYQLNPSENPANEEGYGYGNSFGLVYDDVTTISLSGEINIDVTKAFSLTANAELLDYNMDNEAEAWNLPSIKASLTGNLNIKDKFFAGTTLFFTGERKDLFTNDNPLATEEPVVVTLDSYFDANAHMGYHFTNQLSAFIKANNLANNEYSRWANYPVQGFQILGGLSYKFDF
ncbi:TonB-dependent receptor [Abyssalbus ytuae]|uniref:TonB-dependent receptor n=1 Tax=Abyssalbus ytuae TaxID=2926907 RepID=A0A9E7CSM7_9FLAO|nr:TonB-dependent receptor [Abyssalbus ytuae]UOB16526.1 TonB-dependent receptor [Abyssalbus ytuae]